MVVTVRPIIHPSIRDLCKLRYPGHPRGCPNFGRRPRCPPVAPMFDTVYDLTRPVFAIVTEFNLAAHVDRMKQRHPEWSDAKCRCVLYWQPVARKALRREIEAFLATHPGYRVETSPEAMGVNVTRTLGDAGVAMEWPPRVVVRLVALAAVPIEVPG